MVKIMFFTFIGCLSFFPLAWATEFGYISPIGPANWSKLDRNWEICGSGNRQSPISIPTEKAIYWPVSLGWFNGEIRLKGKLENNKHAIEFRIEGEEGVSPVFITLYNKANGFKDAVHVLQQFHFHWGSNGGGSENRINDVQYAGEMHFVARDINADKNDPNAYLALAIFLQVCKSSDLYPVFGKDNSILEQITSYPDEVEISLRMEDIYSCNGMCTDTNTYFVFRGSFTTPPCTQSVTWWIAKKKLCISEEQLGMLRKQKVSQTGPVLSHNWRPVQEVNDRTILTNVI